MKRKLLLTLLLVVVLSFTFAVAIFAATLPSDFDYRAERTYNYYKDEVADENLLFTAKTIYAYDYKNANQYRFEIITSSEGEGFAKVDANGTPLTWYVISDDNGDLTRNIVVKSTPTIGGVVGGVDADMSYTYNSVDGVSYSKKVVSVNFFGTGVKALPTDAYMATATATPNGSTSEYCKMADGSYLLALYLPSTLTAIPQRLCTRAPIITLEFENNSVKYTEFGPGCAVGSETHYPFAFCANLKSLVIPEGITKLRARDFREAISLEYLKYSSTVLTSENGVFFRGGYPETVVYGENMTFIGYLDQEPYRFYVDTKEAGIILKYLYVPNTINTKDSKLASYRGGVSNSADALTSCKRYLVFFFAGTLEEAKAVGAIANEDQLTMTYDASKASSKGYTYYEPVSYQTYLSNPDYYNNELTGNLLVYGLTKCEAFYEGTHNDEDDGDCTTAVTCPRCQLLIVEAFAEHDIKNEIAYPDGYLCAGHVISGCARCNEGGEN